MNYPTTPLTTSIDWSFLSTFINAHTYTSLVIITDENVHALYGASLKDFCSTHITHTLVIPAGETHKNLSSANDCWQKMQSLNVDKETLILSLGGGMISDLAGFVASCYLRGVSVVHIPTTLMGMIDASLGGKTALNTEFGKNLIGSFYPAKEVFISIHFLQTLSEREFISGLAEIVKYGLIKDPLLFSILENDHQKILFKDPKILKELTDRSKAIKLDIVEKDPFDQGIRQHLNLGHTFAHAFEAATDYKQFTHGEAVSIGLYLACITSHLLQLLDNSTCLRVKSLLHHLKLPTSFSGINIDTLLKFMYSDKKTINGKLNLILLKEMGQAYSCQDIDPSIVIKALKMVEKP